MKKTMMFFATAALMLGAQSWTGVITDTMCGADHKMMKVTPDSKCVRMCVGTGKTYKYALLVGKDVYVISDQKAGDRFAAQKVKVSGTLDEKTKTIAVTSIAPAK